MDKDAKEGKLGVGTREKEQLGKGLTKGLETGCRGGDAGKRRARVP